MVITARLASRSFSKSRKAKALSQEEEVQETYQKALTLLQDPILPVRAHGLLLLRQIVTPQALSSTNRAPVEAALVPSIISIFLQSIQEDDSYIFLNAVQGLAATVDSFGRETLLGLMNIYSHNLEGLGASNLTRQDVEKRIRIGEAFSQVIRRCGDALGLYGRPNFYFL